MILSFSIIDSFGLYLFGSFRRSALFSLILVLVIFLYWTSFSFILGQRSIWIFIIIVINNLAWNWQGIIDWIIFDKSFIPVNALLFVIFLTIDTLVVSCLIFTLNFSSLSSVNQKTAVNKSIFLDLFLYKNILFS